MFVPFRGKIAMPPLRDGSVPRTRVLDLLDRSRDAGIVWVGAPAGYGKTTAVRQWADRDPRPFAWLTIDEPDDDRLRLYRHVAWAINEGEGPGLPDAVLDELGRPRPDVDGVALPLFCNAIAELPPFVLVLDDAHLLKPQNLASILHLVRGYLATGSQIVVVGRGRPSTKLAHLWTEGALQSIGPCELTMSLEEADLLLRKAGVALPPAEVATLLERTEGWPAGLRLGAVAVVQGGSDQVGMFGGRHRLVADYLAQEVLANLSDSQHEFLMRCSILDKLSGAICDATLGTTGSGQILADLEQADLFLFSLDAYHLEYRFHSLFAAMLRAELDARHSDQLPALHVNASRWFENHKFVDTAIDHANRAHDIDRAGHLILAHLPEAVDRGETERLQAWQDPIDDDDAASCAPLSLARAWLDMMRGRFADADTWTRRARAAGWSGPLPDGSPSLDTAITVLRAVLGRQGVAQTGADAARVRSQVSVTNPWYPLACFLDGTSTMLMGDRTRSRILLDEAEKSSPRSGITHIRTVAQQALLETECGDWARAGARAGVALREIEEGRLGDRRILAAVFALAGEIEARMGRTTRAEQLEQHAFDLWGSGEGLPPEVAIATPLLLAELEVVLGHAARALRFVQAARDLSIDDDGALMFHDRILQVQKQLAEDNTGQRNPSSLTSAELRVLRLLPSHLSLGEIAASLYISRNTVKSQAIAIYRKLGVSARSQAVQTAWDYGLIDVGPGRIPTRSDDRRGQRP
jgi:LuxR family maltose regulon positive regulatory protein